MSTSRGPRPVASAPVVGERRRARERALGLLYEAEVKGVGVDAILADLPIPPEPYASELALGVLEHGAELDALIAAHATSWRIDRMPVVDRQLLRLATYELLECRDVPVAVVIDEAVELAKQYSTDDSGRFVNGVLAALAPFARVAS